MDRINDTRWRRAMQAIRRDPMSAARVARAQWYRGVDLWPPTNFAPRRSARFHLVEVPVFRTTGGLFPQAQRGERFRTFFDEHIYVREWRRRHPDAHRSYIDIGAGDGIDMSNTYELARDGWFGVALEGSPLRFAQLSVSYRRHPAVGLGRAYVQPETVVPLLRGLGAESEVSILSLDIDSYDLFVADALVKEIRPRLMILEWNDAIPPGLFFTVLPSVAAHWDGTLFQGASLGAWEEFAASHGYRMTAVQGQALFLEDDADTHARAAQSAEQLWRQHLDGPRSWISPLPEPLSSLRSMDAEQALIALRREFAPHEGAFELRMRRSSRNE